MARIRTGGVSTALAAALLALGLASGGEIAHAHGAVNDRQASLLDLTRRSPLIVVGEVADIVYRNSEPNREEPNGVPHTFVTYKVRDAIRGRTDGTITLRFIGGADGRGGVYMESTTPVFARGQTDILFIKGGVQDDCPLVDCVDGRFRVADGRVYNGWGVPVVEARKALVIGGAPKVELLTMEIPRPPFDAIAARPEIKAMLAAELRGTSIDALRKRYDQEAPARSTIGYKIDPEGKPEPGVTGPPIRKFGEAMRVDEFLAVVKAAAAQAPPPREKPVLADPRARIVVAPPRLAKMAATAATARRTPEEQREFESVKPGAPVSPTNDGGQP